MKKLVVLFSGILLAVACGDDATKSSGNTSSNNTVAANNTSGEMLVKPGTTEACGLDGRVGDTECLQAGLSCQAGQYCNKSLLARLDVPRIITAPQISSVTSPWEVQEPV